MSQRQDIPSAPTPFAAWDELWSRFDLRSSRTVQKRSLAGLVPSAIAVLSMSAVTVVTIVLIVTTVADAGLLFQSHNDAWSRWSSSPAIRFGANGEVPSSYAAIVEEQMNALVLDGAVANAAFVAPDR